MSNTDLKNILEEFGEASYWWDKWRERYERLGRDPEARLRLDMAGELHWDLFTWWQSIAISDEGFYSRQRDERGAYHQSSERASSARVLAFDWIILTGSILLRAEGSPPPRELVSSTEPHPGVEPTPQGDMILLTSRMDPADWFLTSRHKLAERSHLLMWSYEELDEHLTERLDLD